MKQHLRYVMFLALLLCVPSNAWAGDDAEFDVRAAVFYGDYAFGSADFTEGVDAEPTVYDYSAHAVPSFMGLFINKNYYWRVDLGINGPLLFKLAGLPAVGTSTTKESGPNDDPHFVRYLRGLILTSLEFGVHWSVGPGYLGIGANGEIVTVVLSGNEDDTTGFGGHGFAGGAQLSYTIPITKRVTLLNTLSISKVAITTPRSYSGGRLELRSELVAKLSKKYGAFLGLTRFSLGIEDDGDNEAEITGTNVRVGFTYGF